MPTIDEQRAADLSTLAVACLGRPLTTFESQIIEESTTSASSNPVPAPVKAGSVEGAFLRWIATDPKAAAFIDARGIRVNSLVLSGDLDLDNCSLSTSLMLRDCEIVGSIRLDSAALKNVNFRRCTINGVIRGENAVVKGSFEIYKCILKSAVALDRLEVTGALSLSGTDALQISGGDIRLDGAKIAGSVFLSEGFKTGVPVRMHNARMGELDCSGAVLASCDGSLSLDGVTINGDLTMSNGFNCPGEVRLPGAHIQGNLECIGATIGSLICHNMTVDGDFMWIDILNAATARLSLVGVKVKSFRDQKSTWPQPGNLELEGLVYELLTVHEDSASGVAPKGELTPRKAFNATDRIEWINRQEDDRLREPQPWMQLAKVALALGDESGSHKLVYTLSQHRAAQSPFLIRRARIAFAWLREQPFRIAWSIIAILIVSAGIFWAASVTGAIAPREKDSYAAWAKGQPFPAAYPRFNPVIYALENELPLVKFGQDDKWAPDPSHNPIALGPTCLLQWTAAFNSYSFLTFVRWFIIVLGWIQATVLAGALGSRFKS
ncbi:MAG TPA: hypothetical protein VHX63_02160 [Acidobacteriaceae bacterium]|jgi:hypothetical protein|nr:hypothetical protein [Acidobacteriaceae bacterium]